MSITRLLVANRAEIAIRITRAARELDIETVAMAGEDDTGSLHNRVADLAVVVPGRGAAAYLDIEAVVATAAARDCDALHPGYGFLAENAELARACEEAGIIFVGPTSAQLELFGDKIRARSFAEGLGVPLAPGTQDDTSVADAEAFLGEHGAMMIKAVAGGGGRGMRSVHAGDDVSAALERARSEAETAFGSGAVYVERLIEHARHIEVQVIGDGTTVSHLGERECTLQRQNQKIVEVAPSPTLDDRVRSVITDAAISMASAADYRSLGTWEFLVDADDPSIVAFMETNARLQVEHTVTEEVTGIDLVQSQLRIAGGETLADLGLTQRDIPAPQGYAVQARVNMETMSPDGSARPGGGTLSAFEAPSGPGVRTDTYGYVGYRTSPSFDSLLAKVIGHSPSSDYAQAVRRTRRALGEFRVEGVPTNIAFLQALLGRDEVLNNQVTTMFTTTHAGELIDAAASGDARYFSSAPAPTTDVGLAGARIDSTDPLAVLSHGAIDGPGSPAPAAAGPPPPPAPVEAALTGPDASIGIGAPLQGTIVSVAVSDGQEVAVGQLLLVMEAMKMEHEIRSDIAGIVRAVGVSTGDAVFEGHPLVFVEPADVAVSAEDSTTGVDIDLVRDDLQQLYERRAYGLDENRPAAVAKRHGRGHRTARENLDLLVDEGTFVEYGRLMVAAQRKRRSFEDLLENTSGDGMVAGVASVNGDLFDEHRSQAMVMSYDYMVLAGTQGGQNHRKKDRMFEIAEHNRLPVVLLAEGGGGRPGDTDGIGGSGLDCWAFTYFARLSGLVPVVGVANGRCFAGNAVLLGCCDVIIATEGSNIGIGGPAMIEGGGLGIFKPEEVGPTEVQAPNGVIDILVADEEEAMEVAKKYLSYFQGPIDYWEADDQRKLRHLVPENRKRIYDVREIIHSLCDIDTVLELRPEWGHGVITALARVEGRPIGIIANNPHHLAGAIDADGADKGSRFMQLCDAHDVPLLFLCDTPGIMVGPQAEHDATVRHAARMFVTAASIDVPFMTIVLRKGYGLGAQAMAGGSFKAPIFTVAWPTGEFGGMGLEGFVKLGYRKELEAISDPQERLDYYEKRVARLYDMGKAVNTASYFEVDDVIDPAESREWIMMALRSSAPPAPRQTKKRPMVDTW